MVSASPGLTPFGCTGGFESARKPAVLSNAGLIRFPPGRFGGLVYCEKLPPAPPPIVASSSSEPSWRGRARRRLPVQREHRRAGCAPH